MPEATDLEYRLIITTCQASSPFIHGAHFNGRQTFKMTRHGSREAAIAEAFYAVGVNGWYVSFNLAHSESTTSMIKMTLESDGS
jgi:hypothetical protein